MFGKKDKTEKAAKKAAEKAANVQTSVNMKKLEDLYYAAE